VPLVYERMGQSTFHFEFQRKIYTVTDLTQEVRKLIEPRFLDVWVTGEVSNCCAATSGHLYFTLKDRNAQLRVVCFRNQARYLKFKPQDGVSLIARGRLTLYEARGEYQLVAEFLEPAGLGALQLAFEQLKEKLAAEGLFEPARKKPLPVLPKTVGVITSPTGAAIRDILRVLRRRFANMNVVLFPARVQGEGATEQIIQGIRYFNYKPSVDVLIVGRGGGSLEDLWAFNEEGVARAIAFSKLPVISAVGHETDFTIADFVADLRAPTPSAAAEMVVRRKQDFALELGGYERRLLHGIRLKLSQARGSWVELKMHSIFQTLPGKLRARMQALDEFTLRAERVLRLRLSRSREDWLRTSARFSSLDFGRILDMRRAKVQEATRKLDAGFARGLVMRRGCLDQVRAILRERNPELILSRGYSIARDAAGNILRDASSVPLRSEISIRLAQGELSATVRSRRE
jgi:exodeoxyribonuclease VII large subunit